MLWTNSDGDMAHRSFTITLHRLRRLLGNEKILDLREGPFLPGDLGKSWSISYRERLRCNFIHYMDKLGDYKEKTGQLNKAIECFTKGLEADDLAEEFYRHLMACLLQLGKRSEALSVYRRCNSTKIGIAAYIHL